MTQHAAVLTTSDPASVAGAFVWAYKKLFGRPVVSHSSWLIPMAQSAFETAHWTVMYNWNTGYITGGADWFSSPKVTAPLQFTSYPTLGAGAMGQLHWLANHGCMSHADAGDMPGFIAALKASGYAGNADYTAYQMGVQGYVTKYDAITPRNYWDITPGILGAIALGFIGVAGAGAYLIEPSVFNAPAKFLGFHEVGARENPALGEGDPMRIQSLLFKREEWTEPQAKKWLKEHGYKSRQTAESEQYLRFRQESPKNFDSSSFRTKVFGDGIRAVIGR